MAINVITTVATLLHPPFWFCCKLKRSQAEKYQDMKENRLHENALRIQNLQRHNQTKEILFQIRPLVRKR